MRSPVKLLAILLSVTILMGCGISLPDIKPFADKTAEMSTGIGQGYALTEALLSETEGGVPRAKQLKERWELTKKALNALVAYADALAALADAGKKGNESAENLINSLNGLTAAVSPIIPGIPAIPQTVVDAFRLINNVVQKLRARKALREAVSEAKVAIDATATILSLNFTSLGQINQAAGQDLLQDLDTKTNPLRNYHESLTKDNERSARILTLILDYQNPESVGERSDNLQDLESQDQMLAGAVLVALRELPQGAVEEERQQAINEVLEARQEYWRRRAKFIRAELDRIATDFDAYVSARTEIAKRMNTSGVIIKKSTMAVEVWAKTHRDLETALTTNQRVTVLELGAIIKEIADAYEKGVK